MNWYALHVASNHERKVQEQLRFNRIEELTPFWVPDPKRISRFTKKPIERALFPGYVFSRFDPEVETPVFRIRGIIQVLSIAHEPAIIPEADIENIRLLLARPSLIRPIDRLATPNVIPGDRVEVIHGPLTGATGFVSYLAGKTRVVVWVQALHSGVSIEVGANDLMRLRKAA